MLCYLFRLFVCLFVCLFQYCGVEFVVIGTHMCNDVLTTCCLMRYSAVCDVLCEFNICLCVLMSLVVSYFR